MSSSSISELDQSNIIRNDDSSAGSAAVLDLDASATQNQASQRNINPTTLGERFASDASKYLGGRDSGINRLPALKRNNAADQELADAHERRIKKENEALEPSLHSAYHDRL